ncbi:SDR family NAD(P)-dependent oxidoreductase [Actinomadura rayongensis]|uniref:SDR family NAD(P)-dependent oxidoreductase n=1 Tax=Actinomadura rayongensis TaxID=1429076 RepID=A0A6I4W7G4_9ACTN|nr:SDR family NAD(P)-dependent oxidoreductase [Actinomadura rayongensis]MXQ64195.1 SDR family NAD(P)-dependent oxidoreductase [Actinomadura rayongensis]
MSEQKSILVTGAAGGIGAGIVTALAERGHTVYAGVRADTNVFDGLANVRTVRLDVADPASASAAARLIAAELDGRGLAAVVNNAGLIVQGPLELVPPADLRRQFEVNTFGPVFVAQAFLPLLRAARGRIVNISAPTARMPFPMLGALSGSKAALASMSEALRGELLAWGVPVALVEPGNTATEIFARAAAADAAALAAADPERARLYAAHRTAFERAAERRRPAAVDATARVVVRAVEARRPRRHYAVSGEVRAVGLLLRLPYAVRSRLVRRALGLHAVPAGG